MRTIHEVLDRAKTVQKVTSDYKLGLCLGIGQNSLSNYRLGKSLPDEKACVKLASAMGEDPALLTVEMMAQRSKDYETQQLWTSIARRLQMGFSNVSLLAAIAILCIATHAPSVWASATSEVFSADGSLYIMLSFKS